MTSLQPLQPQHSDFTPTRPLQVRVKLARNMEDECLTVAQMSKNLASQQRISDNTTRRKPNPQHQDTDFGAEMHRPRHRQRSKSRTRAEVTEVRSDDEHEPEHTQTPSEPDTISSATQQRIHNTRTQQQIDELKKTIDMHAAVLSDHRDAIRKNNAGIDTHEAMMSTHDIKLNKLHKQQTEFKQAHTSMSSEVDRIKASFNTKTKYAAAPAPTATYTNFKALESRYNDW